MLTGGLAETAELALGEGAEDDTVFRIAGVDRGGRVADRARSATTAAAPHHPGERQMLQSERGGEARRVVAIVGVARDSVDLAHVDSGVVRGFDNRFAGEAEFADRRLSALVVFGLADADDRDPILDGILTHLSYASAGHWNALGNARD